MARRYYARPLASIFLVGLGGCVENKVDDAVQIEELSNKSDSLQAIVERLDRQRESYNLTRDLETTAYLTPMNRGYSVLRTEMGPLTINLEDVQAVEGGAKVTLRVGNVTNATLDQVAATVEWGVADQGRSSPAIASKVVKFPRSFPRGQWTNIDVVLEGVTAAQLAFVRVKDIDISSISLLGRPAPTERSRD